MIRDIHRATDIAAPVPGDASAIAPWRITLRGSSRSTLFNAVEKVAVVGAAAWCNFRVQTPHIPKAGCLLYNGGETVLCYDLTRSQHCSLREFSQDAEFSFRDLPLKLEFAAAPTAPASAVFPELEFRRLRATQRRVLTTPVTTLGSGRPSRLQLPGSQLELCHAAIIWSKQSLTLVDLSETGGGRMQERVHVLRPGQSLQFQDIEVRFVRICRLDELTVPAVPLNHSSPAHHQQEDRLKAALQPVPLDHPSRARPHLQEDRLEPILQRVPLTHPSRAHSHGLAKGSDSRQPVEALVLENMRQRSHSKLWQRKAMLLVGALPLCAIAAILFYRLLNLLAPHL